MKSSRKVTPFTLAQRAIFFYNIHMRKKFALIIVEIDEEENGVVEECVLDEEALSFDDADIHYIVESASASGQLTEREREVLASILKGRKRAETANELFVTESTVKKHSRTIYAKFGVKNRFELLSKLYRDADGLR